MLSKRLSRMLMTGAAVAGMSAAADAALVIDLRATGVTGQGTVANEKTVTNVAPGSIVAFDVFAITTDSNNGNTSDQGILSFAGSFLSAGGTTEGNLVAARAATMTGTGGSNGLVTDLDADGDLDVGSNNNASALNFFSARSTTAPTPQFGMTVLVGTLAMTITEATPLETLVNFRVRVAGTAGSWFEDGSQITSSNFSPGSPVSVNGIPEPAALGLAGLTALGALARRRR
jgi:MYXO-CTERM domain-containing protein